MGYGRIALSVWVPCLVPAELSVYLPASCLVATQEIHHSTCIANHVVGHNAPVSHQVNKVPHPPEGYFLYTNYLGEIVLDSWMFLIDYHI